MDLEANRHQHKYKVKVFLILIRYKPNICQTAEQ